MAKSAVSYIKQELTLPGESFVPEWRRLSDKDKTELKQYAEDEMKALGIN